VTFLRVARRLAQSFGIDVSRFPGDQPTYQVVRLMRHYGINRLLDVGANDGGYATEIRRCGYGGRIVSFEPISAPFRKLARRASNDADWKALNIAVGANTAEMLINVAANSAASSSMLRMLTTHENAAPDARIVGVESVHQFSLDDVWTDVTEANDLVFLKADVQGYENQVLGGVSKHLDRIVGLQLELSMVPLYEGGWLYSEALEWARGHGFELMRLIPGFTDARTGQMLQTDAVFFRN